MRLVAGASAALPMRKFLASTAEAAKTAYAERQSSKEAAKRERWRAQVAADGLGRRNDSVADAVVDGLGHRNDGVADAVDGGDSARAVRFKAYDGWKAEFEPPLGQRAGVDGRIASAQDAVIRRALDAVADALAASAVAGGLEAAARALDFAERQATAAVAAAPAGEERRGPMTSRRDVAGTINAILGMVLAFRFGGGGRTAKDERGAYLRWLAADALAGRLDTLVKGGADLSATATAAFAETLVASLEGATETATTALLALPVLGMARQAFGASGAPGSFDALLEFLQTYLAGAASGVIKRLGSAVRAVLQAYADADIGETDSGEGEGGENGSRAPPSRERRVAALMEACVAQHASAYSGARVASGAVTGFLGMLVRGGQGGRGAETDAEAATA